jgi:secreted trypsin-like serine protease
MFIRTVLTVLLVIHFNEVTLGQQSIVVEETDDARMYMAYILHFNGTNSPSTRVYIACSGVFIKENFILTAAACFHGFKKTALNPSFSVGSNVTTVLLRGSGIFHFSREIHIHPKYDPQDPLVNSIAIVEVNLIHPGLWKPRELGGITTNRFCSMMGWEGYQETNDPILLQIFAVPIVNSIFCEGTYCTRSALTSSIHTCGGLQGAPVFCGDGKVSGIVVRDNFCQGSSPVGGSFISVEDYREWIEEVTSKATKISTASVLFFIGIFLKFLT